MPHETLWGPVKRDREEAIHFLKNHLRYPTMNAWNGNSTYAVNVKVHRVPGLTPEQRDACYRLLDDENAWDESGYNERLEEFAKSWGWRWQIATNGRNGGYLILCQGERAASPYKSICTSCGQFNFQEKETVCGRCRKTTMRPYKGYESRILTVGVDDGEDYEEWDDDRLDDRVTLVEEFDAVCRSAVQCYVAHAMDCYGPSIGVSV